MRKNSAIFIFCIFIVSGINCGSIEDTLTSFLPLSISSEQCTSRTSSEATLIQDGNNISLIGSVIIPTPCHQLEGEIRKDGNVTTVFLKPVASTTLEICIQCLAEASIEASLGTFEPGTHTIKVVRLQFATNEVVEVILEQTLTIP